MNKKFAVNAIICEILKNNFLTKHSRETVSENKILKRCSLLFCRIFVVFEIFETFLEKFYRILQATGFKISVDAET